MSAFKVKDYSYTYGLLIVCSFFPVVFGIIAWLLKGDYLLAFLITFAIYGVVVTFYIKYLNRKQEEYLISADEEGVYFTKYGSFKWNEISSIYGFTQRIFAGRREYKYVRVQLNTGKGFTIEIENCDYEYDDIAKKLNEIGHLPDAKPIAENK